MFCTKCGKLTFGNDTLCQSCGGGGAAQPKPETPKAAVGVGAELPKNSGAKAVEPPVYTDGVNPIADSSSPAVSYQGVLPKIAVAPSRPSGRRLGLGGGIAAEIFAVLSLLSSIITFLIMVAGLAASDYVDPTEAASFRSDWFLTFALCLSFTLPFFILTIVFAKKSIRCFKASGSPKPIATLILGIDAFTSVPATASFMLLSLFTMMI